MCHDGVNMSMAFLRKKQGFWQKIHKYEIPDVKQNPTVYEGTLRYAKLYP